MRVLKLIWKLLLNLLLVPFSLAIVASLIAGYFSQSENQQLENYAVSQENITRLRADKIVSVPLADPSFDGAAIAFLITFLLVFIFMIIYMITNRKQAAMPQ